MLLPSVPLGAIRQPALLYDAGGRVVAANDRVEALAGRTLAGASIAEIRDAFRQRTPGGAALALDELPASRALRGEEAVDVPLEITAADGRTVPVLATASPLWDGDAVTGALVVWQDVSGLVESEVKYRTLFDSIDEGFFLVDVIFDEQDRPVDLLYVEANAAAVRMLGQDWTGRRLTELSPDYERYWFEIFGKVARTGERVRLERYAAPDRAWYDFSVFRVGGPESRRVGNTFLDITERKRAEAALADSEAKYRQLFESLTEGLIVLEPVLDEDGVPASFRWLDVNPAFERLTPLRRDEIIGHDVREVLPSLSPSWVETLARVAETGEPAQGEIHDPDHGGWYSVYAFRPTPGEVAVLLSNVTERRESEERFRSVLDHSLDALYRLDLRTGRYVYTSPAFERVLGRSAEERATRDAEEAMGWIHPDDLPVVAADLARLDETGSAEVEYRVRDQDGRYRWVSNHLSLVRDESGQPRYRDGVARDVTEQKGAEQALAASEARYRELFESMNEGFALCEIVLDDAGRPVDYRFLAVNPAFDAMTGFAADTAVGRLISELQPGLQPVWIERYGCVALTGTPERFVEYSAPLGRWFDIYAFSPAPGRFASLFRDVTEEREVADALVESEANMARAQTAAHLGNWKWDLATNVLFCSDEHCRLYGLAPGDYPLETFIDLVHEDDRQVVRDALAETVNKGTPYDVECRVVRQDGAERVLHGEGEAIRDRDGRVTGLFGIAQDITERKKAEEALREYAEDLQRSNEDLERFAYVASHDLQEPLRPIVSFSQLLERRYKGRLDADADEYIAFIVEGGNRMQALILDLLAYSRANSIHLERHPTDVEAVVASVERSLDHQLREAGAVITRDPLPTVMADPIQLEQVFVNLVSNAIKFRRPDVPLRVHVGIRREDDLWEFSVVDNGIGIEEQYFDQLFVIFKRLHTRDAYPGTGIGLPIVERIVDRHGGRVRVESVPGEGSTFFFTLPAS